MRKRMVSPSFFSDEDLIANFDAWGRLFYEGLWCVADDSGCFEPSPLQLKMQIFPGDNIDLKDVKNWLEKLAELNKIVFYEVAGKNYAWIRNFHKHQTLDRPSPPNIPLPEWLEWCGKEHFGNDRHKWHYKFTRLFDDTSETIRRQVNDVSPRKKEKKERSTSTRRQFDDNSTKEIITKFTECIYPGITPYDIDRLTAYLEDGFESDLIIYAIEEAAANNARRISYITKILDRLRDVGITTREAAEVEKTGKKIKMVQQKNGEVAAPYHNLIVRAPRGDAASPPYDGSAALPDKPSPRREDADSSRDAVSLGNADFPPGQRLAEAWGLDK